MIHSIINIHTNITRFISMHMHNIINLHMNIMSISNIHIPSSHG